MFREIGLADELGSGMRNTYKFTKLYSGGEPQFTEGDVFRTVIPLSEIATMKSGPGEKDEKSVFEGEKSVFKGGKSVFGDEKSVFEGENRPIQEGNLTIDEIKSILETCNYSVPTKRKIMKVYKELGGNQIFSASDVVTILNCAPSTAGIIMTKLKDIQVITPVKGKGKGKYRFVNKGEFIK